MQMFNTGQQIWLTVENERHLLTLQDIPLACRIAASYHNQVAYAVPPDDGFAAETEWMERQALLHMEASSSDDEDGHHRCHTYTE